MAASKIVIDKSKCDGCGKCVEACHEGALEIIDGKAELVREDYCDGLGHCLPACPRDAISFSNADPEKITILPSKKVDVPMCNTPENFLIGGSSTDGGSELRQWPVKIRLIPESSPALKDADLLLVADCSAYAYPRMHEDFIKGKTIMTCCPKFDTGHIEKLTNILSKNDPKSLTVLRMSVPCCSLDRVVDAALKGSGKSIPVRTVIVDQKGHSKEGQ